VRRLVYLGGRTSGTAAGVQAAVCVRGGWEVDWVRSVDGFAVARHGRFDLLVADPSLTFDEIVPIVEQVERSPLALTFVMLDAVDPDLQRLVRVVSEATLLDVVLDEVRLGGGDFGVGEEPTSSGPTIDLTAPVQGQAAAHLVDTSEPPSNDPTEESPVPPGPTPTGAVSRDAGARTSDLGLLGPGLDVAERTSVPAFVAPGRDALIAHLDDVLAKGPTSAHLHVVGADRLRWVNDALGHRAGDAVIAQLDDRLAEAAGPLGLVGRVGSDEFVVLQTGTELGLQDQLLAQLLAEPFEVELGRPITVSFSIGTAELNEPIAPSSGAGALRSAGAAYVEAKRIGGNRRIVYHDDLDSRSMDRLELEQDLRSAIANSELELHYQPIVELASGAAVGFEALVRWEHPVRGRLMPADFIELAETTGLITKLGEFVLNRACSQLREWVAGRPEVDLSVSVNVSALQLARTDLVEVVTAALAKSGLEPQRLVIEITEGSVIDDPEAARSTLEALTALGIRIHADDFGTGYAGLTYLRQFPISALKIDHSFVRGLGSDLDALPFVAAIVGLGTSLGISVIAEGIETEAQELALLEAGCRIGQGHRFSPALSADHIRRVRLPDGYLELNPGGLDLTSPNAIIDVRGPTARAFEADEPPLD